MSQCSLDFINSAIKMLEGVKIDFQKGQYRSETSFLVSARQDVNNALELAKRELEIKNNLREYVLGNTNL